MSFNDEATLIQYNLSTITFSFYFSHYIILVAQPSLIYVLIYLIYYAFFWHHNLLKYSHIGSCPLETKFIFSSNLAINVVFYLNVFSAQFSLVAFARLRHHQYVEIVAFHNP